MNTEKKSKRQERREKVARQERRNRLVVIGSIVAITVLLALFIIVPRVIQANQPPAEVVAVDPGTHPMAKDNSMGKADAPILIEEFSDFQCPYCQRFHEETEPLLRQYYIEPGKVRFVYRSMGNFVSGNVGGVNTESQDAALAMYCAGDQDKFWDMHAYLFGNVVGENKGSFTDKRIKLIAEKAGLSMDAFNSCYDSGKYEDRVQQDAKDGQAVGITSTPSFLITYTVNGEKKTKLIVGAQPFSEFQTQLEAALNEAGAQ